MLFFFKKERKKEDVIVTSLRGKAHIYIFSGLVDAPPRETRRTICAARANSLRESAARHTPSRFACSVREPLVPFSFICHALHFSLSLSPCSLCPGTVTLPTASRIVQDRSGSGTGTSSLCGM